VKALAADVQSGVVPKFGIQFWIYDEQAEVILKITEPKPSASGMKWRDLISFGQATAADSATGARPATIVEHAALLSEVNAKNAIDGFAARKIQPAPYNPLRCRQSAHTTHLHCCRSCALPVAGRAFPMPCE
jgi:hypothetical protein